MIIKENIHMLELGSGWYFKMKKEEGYWSWKELKEFNDCNKSDLVMFLLDLNERIKKLEKKK